MLQVTTWNVNSVNVRLEQIISFCRSYAPDVLLLQELKTTEEKFPFEPLEDQGYNIVLRGQKTYNGVAILSKFPLDEPIYRDFTVDLDEARYIEAGVTVADRYIRVASIYVPNGAGIKTSKYPEKLIYFRKLAEYLAAKNATDEPYIIGGDFNVAPYEIDVYDPIALRNSIGFHIDERQAMQGLLALGYADCWRLSKPEAQAYSWWDYRDRNSLAKNLGMRIDHILANQAAATLHHESGIASEYRALERPSDHAPVWSKFMLK